MSRARLGARRALLLAAMATSALAMLALAGNASAAEAPYWYLSSSAVPTNLHPGSVGKITLGIANHGDGATSGEVVVSDKLPPQLKLKKGTLGAWPAFKIDPGSALSCDEATLSCTTSDPVQPGTQLRVVLEVEVDEPSGTTTSLENEVSVSGGGASPSALKEAVAIAPSEAPFGVRKYALEPEEAGGTPDLRAGSHPFQLATELSLNEDAREDPVALPKDLQFDLPPGMIGNPTTLPKCSQLDFNTVVEPAGYNLCPADTAVGVAEVTISEPTVFERTAGTESVPVFLIEPSPGEPARLGLVAVNVPVVLGTSVRTGSDYGVNVTATDASQTAGVLASQVMIWGVPGDPRHDAERGWQCVKQGFANPLCQAQVMEEEEMQQKEREEGKDAPLPFLSLPTSCGTVLKAPMTADSWAHSGDFIAPVESEFSTTLEPSSCEGLSFAPSIEVAPESTSASTPTGLTVTVKMPQEETAEGTAASAVKSTTVALPKGVQLNPAAAGGGLQACSALQIGFIGPNELTQTGNDEFSPNPVACPEAAKVGTVEIESPDLEHPLKGFVYLAAEDTNPFHAPLVVYIVAKDPVSGVLVKLAGSVTPEEGTGQVISTFENTPQVPFKQLKLQFFGGPRASLSTPEQCGSYPTTTSFTPWSGDAAATPAPTPFVISSGAGGGPCPSNPQPFAPSFAAGSENLQAGAFTNFKLTIGRPDGQQALTGITMHLPPGIAGVLASLNPCPEPALGQEWSCGPESLLGTSVASSGLGGEPFSLEGKAYLTTGYDGAPFGIVVITPAVAGPFNLGNVDVRSRINVNEETAAVTITTDPGPHGDGIPTMLKGVPVQLKQLVVTVNRPGFQFNPTNCTPMEIEGTLTGAQGGSEAVHSPFQVANCASLPFSPKLTATTEAKASKLYGASLRVKIESGGSGQANIQKVDLQLPEALPSRLTTIQKACPDQVFNANPATCSTPEYEGSVIGRAVVHTPILKSAFTGPAYLVARGSRIPRRRVRPERRRHHARPRRSHADQERDHLLEVRIGPRRPVLDIRNRIPHRTPLRSRGLHAGDPVRPVREQTPDAHGNHRAERRGDQRDDDHRGLGRMSQRGRAPPQGNRRAEGPQAVPEEKEQEEAAGMRTGGQEEVRAEEARQGQEEEVARAWGDSSPLAQGEIGGRAAPDGGRVAPVSSCPARARVGSGGMTIRRLQGPHAVRGRRTRQVHKTAISAVKRRLHGNVSLSWGLTADAKCVNLGIRGSPTTWMWGLIEDRVVEK